MIVDIRERILTQKYHAGCPESTYELYLLYVGQGEKEITHGFWYLKKFLLHFDPRISMRIIAQKENRNCSIQSIEEDYLHLLKLVAACHYDCGEYESGVYLVKKVLDLVHFFHPIMNETTKIHIVQEQQQYMKARFMFDSFKEFFNEELYLAEGGIIFPWENKLYHSIEHSNAN